MKLITQALSLQLLKKSNLPFGLQQPCCCSPFVISLTLPHSGQITFLANQGLLLQDK